MGPLLGFERVRSGETIAWSSIGEGIVRGIEWKSDSVHESARELYEFSLECFSWRLYFEP